MTARPQGLPSPLPHPLTLACALLHLVAFLGGALPSRSASPPPVPAPPPNIVFILADDLGIHDLHCYGRTDHHTPHLDQLAREGTRFTSAYCAQPICSPARAAILSGQAPARLHLTTFLPGRRDAPSQPVLHPPIRQALPLEVLTLAERLRTAGYATACIGKWHLGGAGFGPAQQGFDLVHAGRANTTPSDSEGGKGEFDLTRTALRFIEAHRDQPFFLYLAHHAPHIPYSARDDLVRANASAFEPTYAAVIQSLDLAVGQLLARLDQLGLARNTLVVFTSDNGGLHVPELQHPRVTHNGPFRAGKGFLYEGGLRIPLLVRWPDRVPAGRVVDQPVLQTDWVPTLLALAGQPPADPLDGIDLSPLLLGHPHSPPRRAFAWHFPHYTNQGGRPGAALRLGPWKLIEFYDTDSVELFHLDRDPAESRNLAPQHPRRTQRLRRQLHAWRDSLQAQLNSPNPNADPLRFRALYLDFDPSRFHPASATPDEWTRIHAWRRAMDDAVRPTPLPQLSTPQLLPHP